jgi:Ca2+-binding RTX toxin-like protein
MRAAAPVCGLLVAAALTVPARAEAAASSAAPVCHGHRATIVGTSGDNVLDGTPHADVIVGRGGADTIRGLGGDDWICGGAGNDVVDGGRGDDHEYGQGRYDHLTYSPGHDVIDGGALADNLYYEGAPRGVRLDLRRGTAAIGREHDVVRSVDWVRLTRHSDSFVGTDQPEIVYAGGGADVVEGRGGDDMITASRGDDAVEGGAGDDTVHGNAGDDLIVDLQGQNFISDGSTSPSTESGVIRTGPDIDRVYLGFYGSFRVRTGAGRDTVHVDRRAGATTVRTGRGHDVLQLSGDDYTTDVVAFLGPDDDVLECGGSCGGATVHGGDGVNRVNAHRSTLDLAVVLGPNGSISSPTTTVATGFTRVRTGSGDDVVTGSDTADTIITRDGDDTIDGRGGDDAIDAGGGTDTADGGGGDDRCFGVEHPSNCETVA